MRSKTSEQLRKEQMASFLRLSPVDRMLKMENVFHEMLTAKARDEGVTEREMYRRLLAQKDVQNRRSRQRAKGNRG